MGCSCRTLREEPLAKMFPKRSPWGVAFLLEGSRDPALRHSGAGFSFRRMTRELVRLFLRHIRNVERLASFGQRDPRIPQASIMFALLGVVCFLR
jgi:hypothetical protein